MCVKSERSRDHVAHVLKRICGFRYLEIDIRFQEGTETTLAVEWNLEYFVLPTGDDKISICLFVRSCYFVQYDDGYINMLMNIPKVTRFVIKKLSMFIDCSCVTHTHPKFKEKLALRCFPYLLAAGLNLMHTITVSYESSLCQKELYISRFIDVDPYIWPTPQRERRSVFQL